LRLWCPAHFPFYFLGHRFYRQERIFFLSREVPFSFDPGLKGGLVVSFA
jgi:hypothetical protein